MADYSELIEKIRSNNKKLEEKEKQSFQRRQEEEQQRKEEEEKSRESKLQMQKVKEQIEKEEALIREKVISYLLEIIKENQKLDKKVEKITLIETALLVETAFKQEIQVDCKNVNAMVNPNEMIKNSISFEECFDVQSIKQIHTAFGLRYSFPKSINQGIKVADGLFRIFINWDDSLDFVVHY